MQTIDAPGASVATGIDGVHAMLTSAGASLTDTLCSVTLPEFVAVNVYVTS
jgi:hypothetical protein